MAGITSIQNGKKGGRPAGSRAKHTIEAQALKVYLIEQVIAQQKPLVAALIKRAKNGDMAAIREIFDRVLGKIQEPSKIEPAFILDMNRIREEYE